METIDERIDKLIRLCEIWLINSDIEILEIPVSESYSISFKLNEKGNLSLPRTTYPVRLVFLNNHNLSSIEKYIYGDNR